MSHKNKKKRREPADNSQYRAYTDGGCLRNPGGAGGYGVTIVDTSTGELHEYSKGYFSTTNNRMELMAMLVALENIPSNSSVLLCSDSKYALGVVSGEYNPTKNLDLISMIYHAKRGKSIHFRWVPGHSGISLNEHCDSLASQAMRHPTEKDEGYVWHPNEDAPQVGQEVMSAQISLPKSVSRFYKGKAKYPVHAPCANTIRYVNDQTHPTYMDIRNLKTYGCDGWSKVDVESFMPKTAQKFVRKFFTDDARVKSCLKWYGRGLALDLAIRRELLSEEMFGAERQMEDYSKRYYV